MDPDLLLRSMGAIDDDLIAEARTPMPRKHRVPAVLTRYVALAACLALLLGAVYLTLPRGDAPVLRVGEAALLSGETAELPLISTMQLRTGGGTEVPLHLTPQGTALTLTAGAGSSLLDSSGNPCDSLRLTAESDLLWLLDLGAQERFTLTLEGDGVQILVCACLSEDLSTLRVSASRQ